MDFRDATSKFADPDFDGAPVVILDDSIIGNDNGGTATDDDLQLEQLKQKFHVNGMDVEILNAHVQFIDASSKFITENLIDYTRKNILGHSDTLEDFLQKTINYR